MRRARPKSADVSLRAPVSLALMGERGTRAVARIAQASPMLQRRGRARSARPAASRHGGIVPLGAVRPVAERNAPVGKARRVIDSYKKADRTYLRMKAKAKILKLAEPARPGQAPQSKHAHAHDMLLLATWVEQMMALEPGEQEQRDLGWLDFFREQRQRYAACFEELARQTTVHSERLAALFSKLWAGDSALHAKLLESYERALADSVHIESEMRTFAQGSERYATFARRDHNRTSLELQRCRQELAEKSASVAQLEQELDHYHDENVRMRAIIVNFLDPNFLGGQPPHKGPKRGRARKEAERQAERQAALEEAARQGDPKALARASAERANELAAKAEEILGVAAEKGSGGDAKDKDDQAAAEEAVLCAVTEHEAAMMEFDERVNGVLNEGAKESKEQERLVAAMDGMVGAVAQLAMRQAEQLMAVPQAEVGCQTEAEAEEAAEEAEDPPPPAPAQEKRRNGAQIPKALRKLMASFPKSKRVMAKKNLLRLILHMQLDKLISDEAHDNAHTTRLSLAEFSYQFLMNKYGLRTLADWHTTQLVASVLHHGSRSERAIRLFGDMTGIFRPDEKPPLDQRDTNFFFRLLRLLSDRGEFSSGLLQDTDMQIDVSRAVAREAVRELFETLPMGNVMGALGLLEPPSESGSAKHWDLDDVVAVVLEQWEAVKASWRLQLELLFQKYATVYYVDAEGQSVQVARADISGDMDTFGTLTFEGFALMLRDVDEMLEDDEVLQLFDESCRRACAERREAAEALWKEARDPDTHRKFYYNVDTRETTWERPYDPEDFKTQEVDCDTLIDTVFSHELLEHSWTGPIRSAEVPDPPQHMLEYKQRMAERAERAAAAAAAAHAAEHEGHHRSGSRQDMLAGGVRSGSRQDMGGVRSGSRADMGGVRSGSRADMGGVRSGSRAGTGGVRSGSRMGTGHVRGRSASQSRRARSPSRSASPSASTRPPSAASTAGAPTPDASRPASAVTTGAPSRPASAVPDSSVELEPAEKGARPMSAAPSTKRRRGGKKKKGAGKKARPASAAAVAAAATVVA